MAEKKAAQAAVQPPQNDFFKTMTAEAYRASAAAPKAPSFASDVQLPKRPQPPAEQSDIPERSAVPEKPAPAFSAAPAARAARPVSVFPDDLEAALFGGSESRIETKPAAPEPASEEPEEAALPFDLQSAMKRGHNLKDTICPDSLEFHRDYFKMGSQYGRVLFLKDYASYIKDSMILELTDLNRRMMLSIDMIPVPTDEAVREVENKLLGVETNVTNWQRRQNSNQNFSAVVPYDLEQQRKETREMLDDLTTRDQRMLFAVVTLVHLADSKEELDSDTETLQSIARKHLCQLAKLSFQQQDGLITALPLGLRRIDALRTLTTEALAVLMPFKAQEIRHRHGIYYGQNAISKNLILADRKELLNGNGFILGVSGSGKSFAAKREITKIALSTNDDIIIIDPEAEYRPLVEGLGGEVIEISATSPNHINALDMESG